MDQITQFFREQNGWTAAATIALITLPSIAYFVERMRRSGWFQVLLFDWKPLPIGRTILFKPFKGNYNDVPKRYEELLELAKTHMGKIPQEMWALYYDEPSEVGPDDCRTSIGIVMEEKGSSKFEKVLLRKGFIRVDDIPTDFPPLLHLSFPYTGPLSVIASVTRVYAAFAKEWQRIRETRPEKNIASGGGVMLELTRELDGVTEFYALEPECEPLMRVRGD